MAEACARFAEVTKHYPAGRLGLGRRAAVRGVSFEVGRGEVVGLVGPNRAGKTTLVKLLLSLCRADGGSVERLGRPVSDRSTLAGVGYVHESPAFPRYLSAGDVLDYYGALAGVPRSTLRGRAPALLDRVGLGGRDREPIAGFSKGMLQRLGLAQALANDPALLVLDEPGEGLDLSGRDLVTDLIRAHRRGGRSALLVTHALADAEALCDRVVVLVDGRVAREGSPASLARAPSRPGGPRGLEAALKPHYTGGAGR